jgi:hypothetical protein
MELRDGMLCISLTQENVTIEKGYNMDIIRGAMALAGDAVAAYDHFNSFHETRSLPPNQRPQPPFLPEHDKILDAIVGVNHRSDNARRYCVLTAFDALQVRPAEALWYMQRWDIANREPGVDYTHNPHEVKISSSTFDSLGMPPLGLGSPEQTMSSIAMCLLGVRYCCSYQEVQQIVADYEVRFGIHESTYAMVVRQAAALTVEIAAPFSWFGYNKLEPKCTASRPLL